MLKIYFTASTSFDGKYQQQYKNIIKCLKDYGHKITSGIQIVSKDLREQDKKLTEKEIFKREFERIQKSDCVIAEVTHPSHGVGSEITFSLINSKPVLGLVFEDGEDVISPMIAGNPSDNFFLERYNNEKLPYVLKNYLDHIEAAKERKGKLVVIDGGNGSGKTTQAKMLVEYLTKQKIPTKYLDFPQYYSSFHGKTVAKFLRGEFGAIDEVSPYLASLAYALDRASIKREMEDFLINGGYIIANRYATSSMGHQAAKITNEKEKKEFLKWLYELEYKVHKIPKENLVIYLYVPWQVGMKLSENKGERAYLKNQVDIEEADIKNRIETEKMFINLAKSNKHWVLIDCMNKDKILTPGEIHKKIINVLKQRRIF